MDSLTPGGSKSRLSSDTERTKRSKPNNAGDECIELSSKKRARISDEHTTVKSTDKQRRQSLTESHDHQENISSNRSLSAGDARDGIKSGIDYVTYLSQLKDSCLVSLRTVQSRNESDSLCREKDDEGCATRSTLSKNRNLAQNVASDPVRERTVVDDTKSRLTNERRSYGSLTDYNRSEQSSVSSDNCPTSEQNPASWVSVSPFHDQQLSSASTSSNVRSHQSLDDSR
jgi:hypothetical protein